MRTPDVMKRKSRSTTRLRYRMRCPTKSCGRRWTLKKHPDLYARKHRCPRCDRVLMGSEGRRELERLRALAKQDTCTCYTFPHARGTLQHCRDFIGVREDKYGNRS